MVEYVLAKDESGVRFPYPAQQKSDFRQISIQKQPNIKPGLRIVFFEKTVDNLVDMCIKDKCRTFMMLSLIFEIY